MHKRMGPFVCLVSLSAQLEDRIHQECTKQVAVWLSPLSSIQLQLEYFYLYESLPTSVDRFSDVEVIFFIVLINHT